jgi:hypothetical protein
MKFRKNKSDRSLIKRRIWLASDTSDVHIALAWVDVGRSLLPLIWGLRFFPLNIGSHSWTIFS